MSERFVLALDLDNTLFDTQAFFDDVSQMAANRHGASLEQWRADYPQFYEYKGHLRTYDLLAHLGSLAIDADAFREDVAELAVENNYLYDDVEPFLQSLPEDVEPFVLTFGKEWTQVLKLATCGLTIPAYTVMNYKGLWLQRHFGAKRGMMIDDKLVPDLPARFTMAQIDRAGDGLEVPNTLKDIEIRP